MKISAARVFVVDDEVVIASTLTSILIGKGFDAVAFTNPLRALSQAQTETPHLLISDVMMPELSGIDLAISLKRLNPSMKVLLFSGQAATEDLLQKSRQDGYDFHLLTKPVHPTDLLKKIHEISYTPRNAQLVY